MKPSIAFAVICLAFFAGVSPVWSQTQEVEGYTFISGPLGPQVCLGEWVPSTDVALPGVCRGDLMSVSQSTALSSRLSADRLDQLLVVLNSIDEKMDINNAQLRQLIEAAVNTQALINQQVSQVGELLDGYINKRFEALPQELMSNDMIRKEVLKLKNDILKEVEKAYQKKQPVKKTK